MARDPTHGAGPTILLFDRDRAERLVSLEERPGASASRTSCGSTSTASWGLDELADTFDLDEETRAAFSDASTVTSFRDQGHYVHVTVNAPDSDAGDSPIEVECVVGDQWVVTAHERPVPVLEAFTELAEGSGHTGELDGTGFLAALLEWCSTSSPPRSSAWSSGSRRSASVRCTESGASRPRSTSWWSSAGMRPRCGARSWRTVPCSSR